MLGYEPTLLYPSVIAGNDMKTNLKRNKVFELLGAKPTNQRWAWCAISPDHRRAIFTLWEHKMQDGRTRFLSNEYNKVKRLGEADQQKILDLVMKNDIPAYGLVCVAQDPAAVPKSIKEIKGDYLIKLKIVKDSEGVLGKHCERVLMAQLVQDIGRLGSKNGLLDLEGPPMGNGTPDRALSSGSVVIRDSKVRAYVIESANGKCEFCGKKGFLMANGKRYIEAHHIIALSSEGRDVVENVIALCPDHHRQAHYGIDAEKLEEGFIKRILSRPKSNEA